MLDKTANCRKEKDKSLCVNYFSPEGVLVQVRDSGERKDGRWFLMIRTVCVFCGMAS